MSNDTVYLLTLSNNTSEDGNIYITDPIEDDDIFGLSMSIRHAKVFCSRQDAWSHREDIDRREWQITSMSAKAVFERKLKSK